MSKDIYRDVAQLIKKTKGKETVVQVKNLQTNKDGFNNDIAMFHLNYSQDGVTFSKGTVMKKFNGDVEFNKELNILRSKTIKRRIHIPTIYFEDNVKKMVLMERVEGVTLDKYNLASSRNNAIEYKLFGATLAQIHSIDIEDLREYFMDHDLRQNDYISFYIQSLKNRVIKFEDPVYLIILENITKMFKGISYNEVLNHGDYHFWNTIITNENTLYILDWEKAFIGDYRYDLANTLVLGNSWFGTNFKEPMLEAYQNITNKQIDHLECFEALISFDSFTKVVPLIHGADDSHIRDRTFEWLKRRYELFVKHNGIRIIKAEEYLFSKGISVRL